MSTPAFTTRPELLGTQGMVASTHWLASAAGMSVLESGGNAADAAVAAGLVLHVVEPHLNGLGGDMPLLVHDASAGTTRVICGQGVAPADATIAAYRDLGLHAVPGTGHLAAVVPGAWGAWMHLLATRGSRPLAELAAPAIGHASAGYPLLPTAANAIAAVAPVFRDHWTSSGEVYLTGDGAAHLPLPGARFRQPQLARTLERLAAAASAAGGDVAAQAEAARAAFYSGFVAEAIDAFARQPQWDGLGQHRAFLTGADLDRWRATEEAPATVAFAGARIYKPGLWSQGPVLLQQLSVLAAAGIAEVPQDDPAWIHLVVEACKLAMADREAWYGDSLPDSRDPQRSTHAPPSPVTSPGLPDALLSDLLDPRYAVARSALIGQQADATLRPGAPGGRRPRLPQQVVTAMREGGQWPSGLAEVRPGEGEPTLARGDTCHLDVVDRWGNVVSATPSGGWLQSSPVVPGLGLSLPTRGQMFWLEEGLPASLVPGRRPRTTLSPSLLVTEDGPARTLSFGTPGGDQQDQWTVPFLLRHLLGGAGLQEAIDAPSFHSTHGPSSFAPRGAEVLGLHLESRFDAAVAKELRRRGHRVVVAGPWTLGRISAAGVRADGMLHAAANPRGNQGYAVGR